MSITGAARGSRAGVTIEQGLSAQSLDMDDAQLEAMWLHGRPPTTRRAYAADLAALRRSAGAPLASLDLAALQRFADGLAHLAPRSQARRLSAVKSFYGFHAQVGTLPANPAAALTLPPVANDLAERILTEPEVTRLLAAAASHREYLMLRLLYVAGLRASELCGLRWRHLTARANGEGQLSITGKGGKTRFVLLGADAHAELVADRPDGAKPGDPLFPAARDSRRPIAPRQLAQICKRVARAAGVTDKFSPHFMRHAHASHALDNGAPISLVQATLGHSSVATTSRYLHAKPDASSGQYLRAQNSEGAA